MSPEKMSKRQERREKMRSQAQRSRLMMIGGIVLVALVLVLLIASTQNKSVQNIIAITPVDLPNANGLTIGDPNAKVTIDVFEDFQCPACKQFSEQIEPMIIENLVKAGKAKYTFHNYPFIDGSTASDGGESDQAANAAMCANDQGKFWDMKKIMYTNWNGENQGGLSNARLEAMAESLGLDMTKFNNCFDANTFKKDIQADFDLGVQMGVSGTPSVFVNGTRAGQPGYIASYQEIADAVAAAQ
ncbi:MAG: thioredoxin domain-containing protein [Anaerolineales bacterium]